MKLNLRIYALMAMLLCFAFQANAQVTTEDELKAAIAAGGEVTLGADIKIAGKLIVGNAVTIDGKGFSITADETATWYTVSGKLNIKSYKTHLVNINSNNVTLKNIVLDCNNNATGINVYCAQDVVFEDVEIVNVTKGTGAAITVNGSTLTAKSSLTIKNCTVVGIDVSNGSGVTSDLGFTVEEGTVLDLADKVFKFAGAAVLDVEDAVDADGNPYFVAKDVAYYYTEAQMRARTTSYSNGLTLVADVDMGAKDLKIGGTFDLNGHTITFDGDNGLYAAGNTTIDGNGYLYGTVTVADGKVLVVKSGTFAQDVTEYCEYGYGSVMNSDGTYSVKAGVYNLVEGVAYTNATDIANATVKYSRTLSGVGKWYALYLPFEIPVSFFLDNDYSIASYRSIHNYDEDEDGVVERLTMELKHIKNAAAKLKANYPYFVRANTEDALNLNIELADVTLYAAKNTSLSVSNVYTTYTLTGTYEPITSTENETRLALYANGVWDFMDGTLKPFRHYLTITNKDGSDVILPADALKAMRIVASDEDGFEGTTAVETIEAQGAGNSLVYDLAGRPVAQPVKGSLYIVNGKKVIY